MALDTYANLKQAIADHLDRDDLTQFVDDFIDIAEARFRDELRFREILTRDEALTLSDGDRTLAIPADFVAAKSIRVINPYGAEARRYLPPLVQLSEQEFVDKSVESEGFPKHFTLSEQFEFDREADQDYTVHLLYYTAMTALSDGNTSNELLVRAADVYLYGALSASAPFLMNDERIPVWERLYTSGRDRVNGSNRKDYAVGTQVARAKGV